MILLNGASLIFSVICVTILSSATGISLSRTHNYPNQFAYYDYQSYENTSISYVICDKLENNATTKQCTVVLENNSFDKKIQPVSCNITLEPEKGNYKIERVVPFGKEKSIVIWRKKSNTVNVSRDTIIEVIISIATVHFSNCKIVEEKLALSAFNIDYGLMPFITSLIKYEEHFEIIYPNDHLCNNKYCKITFDEEGNFVSDTVPSLQRSNSLVPFITPVNSALPTLGYVIVEQNLKTNDVSVSLFRDNVLNTLKTYPLGGFTAAGYTSTAHDTVGFCSIGLNKTVNCAQFDTYGNLKLEVNLIYDYQIFLISMLNLENGGFLLLTDEKLEPESQNIDWFGKTHEYHVTKYDDAGKRVGSIKLRGLHCVYRFPYAKIFQKNEKEYCVSFTCFNSYNTFANEEAGFVDLAAKCFFEKKLL